MSEDKNHNIQKQWDAAKVVFRGKLIPVHAYIHKEESSQINNINYFKKLEKEE